MNLTVLNYININKDYNRKVIKVKYKMSIFTDRPDNARGYTCSEAGVITMCPGYEDIGDMDNTWVSIGTTRTDTTGTIGMFGAESSYYFWMEFDTDADDTWWLGATSGPYNFRVLFQMGDDQSEWTGVKGYLDSDATLGSTVELSGINVSNNVVNGGSTEILEYA